MNDSRINYIYLGNPILRGRIRCILHVEDIALQSKPYSGYDISSSNLFGCLGILNLWPANV